MVTIHSTNSLEKGVFIMTPNSRGPKSWSALPLHSPSPQWEHVAWALHLTLYRKEREREKMPAPQPSSFLPFSLAQWSSAFLKL